VRVNFSPYPGALLAFEEWFLCNPSNRWTASMTQTKCEPDGNERIPFELFSLPPFGDGQMKMKMGLNTHIKFAL